MNSSNKISADWQSHMERISNFLIFENNGGINFFAILHRIPVVFHLEYVNKYQEEDVDDFSNFQYFDAESSNSNFEKTSHMISTIKETSIGDHETSLETSQKTNLETNLDSTHETDKAVLSDSIHEKLSSTLMGNNHDVKYNVIIMFPW